eukprot:3385069-Amphidinium_carterae.1
METRCANALVAQTTSCGPKWACTQYRHPMPAVSQVPDLPNREGNVAYDAADWAAQEAHATFNKA